MTDHPSKRSASTSSPESTPPPTYPGLGHFRDIKPLPNRNARFRRSSKFQNIREKAVTSDTECEDDDSDSDASTELGTALSLSDVDDQLGSPAPPSPFSENERMGSISPESNLRRMEDDGDLVENLIGSVEPEIPESTGSPMPLAEGSSSNVIVEAQPTLVDEIAVTSTDQEYFINVPTCRSEKGKEVDPEERGRNKRRRCETTPLSDLEEEVNDADDEMETEGLLEALPATSNASRSGSEEASSAEDEAAQAEALMMTPPPRRERPDKKCKKPADLTINPEAFATTPSMIALTDKMGDMCTWEIRPGGNLDQMEEDLINQSLSAIPDSPMRYNEKARYYTDEDIHISVVQPSILASLESSVPNSLASAPVQEEDAPSSKRLARTDTLINEEELTAPIIIRAPKHISRAEKMARDRREPYAHDPIAKLPVFLVAMPRSSFIMPVNNPPLPLPLFNHGPAPSAPSSIGLSSLLPSFHIPSKALLPHEKLSPVHNFTPARLRGQHTRTGKHLQRRSPTSILPARAHRGRRYKSKQNILLPLNTNLVGQQIMTVIHTQKFQRDKRRIAVEQHNYEVDSNELGNKRNECISHWQNFGNYWQWVESVRKGCWWLYRDAVWKPLAQEVEGLNIGGPAIELAGLDNPFNEQTAVDVNSPMLAARPDLHRHHLDDDIEEQAEYEDRRARRMACRREWEDQWDLQAPIHNIHMRLPDLPDPIPIAMVDNGMIRPIVGWMVCEYRNGAIERIPFRTADDMWQEYERINQLMRQGEVVMVRRYNHLGQLIDQTVDGNHPDALMEYAQDLIDEGIIDPQDYLTNDGNELDGMPQLEVQVRNEVNNEVINDDEELDDDYNDDDEENEINEAESDSNGSDNNNDNDGDTVTVVSEPPPYHSENYPRHIPFPNHLRNNRPVRPAQPAPLPRYVGNRYSRNSPSPPPPYNATTDRQTLIEPVFIEDSENGSDDGTITVRSFVRGARNQEQNRRPVNEIHPLRRIDTPLIPLVPGVHPGGPVYDEVDENDPELIVGAFPRLTRDRIQRVDNWRNNVGRIVHPEAGELVQQHGEARTAFDAALDMEEGDEAAVDGLFESDQEDEENQNVGGALGRIGGLIGRWLRW